MAGSPRPDDISWEAVIGCFDAPPFADNDIPAALLEAAPLTLDRKALSFALGEAAKSYAFDYWRQSQPDSNALKKQARAVSVACKQLLKSVGIHQNPLVPPLVEANSLYPFMARGGLFAAAATEGAESGETAVVNALQRVGDLKRWADSLATVADKRGEMKFRDRRKRGRSTNDALNGLLGRLSDIYISFFEDLPSFNTSRSTGSADEAETVLDGTSLEARMYESGDPVPVRFARLLWEVSAALRHRGIPAPETPGAMAQAWYRWKREFGVMHGLQ